MKGVTSGLDVASVLQPPGRRMYLLLSMTYGQLSNLDVETEHLRWMGDTRFVIGGIKVRGGGGRGEGGLRGGAKGKGEGDSKMRWRWGGRWGKEGAGIKVREAEGKWEGVLNGKEGRAREGGGGLWGLRQGSGRDTVLVTAGNEVRG